MPANPKHLNTNKWSRFGKISAAIFGGFLVTTLLHLAIVQWVGNFKTTINTWRYSIFLIWMVFLFVPFFFKKVWKCWMIYLGLMVFFGAVFFLGRIYHPVI